MVQKNVLIQYALAGLGVFMSYNLARQGLFGAGVQDSAYGLCKAIAGEQQCNLAFAPAVVARARARSGVAGGTSPPASGGSQPPASGTKSALLQQMELADPNICAHMSAWQIAVRGTWEANNWERFRTHEIAIAVGYDPGPQAPPEFTGACRGY